MRRAVGFVFRNWPLKLAAILLAMAAAYVLICGWTVKAADIAGNASKGSPAKKLTVK